MTLQLLDQPFDLGPVRLASRAVFVAENFALASPDGDLTDLATDWLIEQARQGWGLILLGLDTFGSPTLEGLTVRRIEQLQLATRRVEVGLALHGDGGWGEKLDLLIDAGVRVFDSPHPLPLSRGELAVGRRVATPEAARDVTGADFVHLGPTPAERLQLVGGTLKQPYGYELQGLEEGISAPLMFSGRVKDAIGAERVLKYYPVDLVGIGRGALAAPGLLDAARRNDDWMPCTGCMACVAPDAFEVVGCAVTIPFEPVPYGADTWQIVGASAAAMRLALALDAGGHRVRIHTAGEPVGGAVRRRGRIPQQAESMEAAIFLRGQLRDSNIELRVDLPDVLDAQHVVVSLPEQYVPEAGWKLEEGWLDGLDILGDTLDDRGPFQVWGDTLLAAELAAFFAMTAREAQVVCDPSALAADTHPSWATYYRTWLEGKGVTIATSEPREGWTQVVAGRSTIAHPAVLPLTQARPDALVIPDAYEPFAQRRALECAFASFTM